MPLRAQSFLCRVDSTLTARYRRMGDIDTAYISRPRTKWTIRTRMNLSGAKIETEGMNDGRHFKAEMEADKKATLCVGVSYLGFSLSAALGWQLHVGCLRSSFTAGHQ